MRVNKVDNSTNFKMGLKIDVKAEPKLKQASLKTVEKFVKLGKKVRKIIFYNVFVNKDLNYEIRKCTYSDKTDYFAELKKEEALLGKYYEYTGYCGGCEETSGGWYPNTPMAFRELYGIKAQEQYDRFKKLSTENQLAWYTRILEKNLLNSIKKEEAKKIAEDEKRRAADKAEERRETAVNNLMKQYWYIDIGAKKTEPKKGFFKRLFHRT